MSNGLFGRTNETFPAKWLSLIFRQNAARPADLVEAALQARTVLDISTNPALWCGQMRGTDAVLMATGSNDLERAENEQQSHDFVQAHLIEILCAVGREHLDFYFLRLRQPLQEFQISGALIALEACRQEGNIRFTGVAAESISATLNMLQFHDAFEAILLDEGIPRAPAKLLAKQRRMSIITRTEDVDFQPEEGQAALICVSSQNDILAAMRSKVAADE